MSLYDILYEKIIIIKDEDGNLIDKGNIINKIKIIVEDKSG